MGAEIHCTCRHIYGQFAVTLHDATPEDTICRIRNTKSVEFRCKSLLKFRNEVRARIRVGIRSCKRVRGRLR